MANTQNKKLNVAVIGCSWMAKQHMDGVVANDKAHLYAICDTAQSQIDARLKEFSPDRVATDYREFLDDPNIDIAIIVTPDYYHLEMTEAFLRAGKHVLCEKPMALTMEECEKMIKVSKECDKLLMVGQVCRCNPQFQMAKKLIDAGEIGELFYVESEYAHDYSIVPGFDNWRKDPRRHGFIGGGCHAVDLLRWIAGDPIDVYAVGNKKNLTDWPIQDDTNVAIYNFPNGVIGKVFVSIGCKRNYTMRSCFYGTKGTLICTGQTDDSYIMLYQNTNGTDRKLTYHEGRDYNIGHRLGIAPKDHNVAGELKELIESIETGKPLLTSPVDGASSVAVCCASIEASRTGERVVIKYPKA